MNILLLGSGGREHALAWKLNQSKLCDRLHIAPGNAGTSQYGTNVDVPLSDFVAIKKFVVDHDIGMVIVGPEEPLVNGLADQFEQDPLVSHIPFIGPTSKGAQLEGSKSFAKKFMQRHKIPTASYREFDSSSYDDGVKYLQQHSMPVVLKADGLAAGKGVIICKHTGEAMAEFELMLQQSKFGDAGKKVVVEEFLTGIELSVFVITDGDNYLLLPQAKDYKRIGEGDKGENTGGMGAISPVPFADPNFLGKVESQIIQPTINGLKEEGISYKGFIFFGLIEVDGEPFVIEYNCRLGDPETQVVLPRLKNDLVELLVALSQQKLSKVSLQEDDRYAATIVAVSGGYPGSYEKGFPIQGLDIGLANSLVFHSGTIARDSDVVTNGGRVLCVTSFGTSIDSAVRESATVLEQISFDGMYYRRDIGYEFRDS